MLKAIRKVYDQKQFFWIVINAIHCCLAIGGGYLLMYSLVLLRINGII